MKKTISFILAILLILPVFTAFGSGFVDRFIESEPIAGHFRGRPEALEMMFNLQFVDMDAHSWAMETVVRMGAIGLITGYDRNFRPDALISRGQAVTHIMRALGYEWEAMQDLTGIQAQLPPGVSTPTLIELSFLRIAAANNIITHTNFNDAMWETGQRQTEINAFGSSNFIAPAYRFRRDDPITREELALIIHLGLEYIDSDLWDDPGASIQFIYAFPDWQYIAPENLLAAETMLMNQIMGGVGGNFLPRQRLTRAELAVILGNMERIHFGLNNIPLQRRAGVVAGISTVEHTTPTEYSIIHEISIRTAQGTRDLFEFSGTVDNQGYMRTYDAIVFKDFQVGGLQDLEEGDAIEYIVNTQTNRVLYVNAVGASHEFDMYGVLTAVDRANNQLTLRQADGFYQLFNYAGGMSAVIDGVHHFAIHGITGHADGERVPEHHIPFGSTVRVTLLNNIIVRVTFVGEPTDIAEGSGIVLENNPDFGYMVILERGGNVIIRRYFERDMEVLRREHFETGGVGYIAQMFPYFGFNPLVSTISQIEPGDLIFFRTDPDDFEVIVAISASTNFSVQYGRVVSMVGRANYTEILVQYENGSTAWFSVANGIRVMRDGRPSSIHHLAVGDWVRMLVNDAVTAPGVWTETVKEMMIEGPERHVSTFIRGNLSSINTIQWRLTVENAMVFDRNIGWTNYQNLANYDLSGRDIEFFDNHRRISRDEAARFARDPNITVYIALEQSFVGDRVRMVTFRDSRDTALAPDTVVSAPGTGHFELLSWPGRIYTDEGTIVVRHGRLVSGRDIHPGDFVSTVLNGDGRAAIVNITQTPGTDMLMFVRGRVQTIEEGHAGRGFTVRSQSALIGTDWMFTPVNRLYEIDHRTIFWVWDQFGNQYNFETFIDYTATSVVANYYTIVAEGSRAAFVVDAPFANGAIRGTIFEVGAAGFGIRNVEYMEPYTGTWRPMPEVDNQVVTRLPGTNSWNTIAAVNGTMQITTVPGTLIAKENRIVTIGDLRVGEQVLIMTNEINLFSAMPQGAVVGGPLNAVAGFIIRVEN